MSGMTALPGVSSYLARRPELIGIGVEPKLVIDAVAVSTGIPGLSDRCTFGARLALQMAL